MPKKKRPTDTLEQIVQDAIERERIINEQHPERNGYGMIQGEADDLIHRIEHLEHNQLRAQGVKIKRREDRVRVIGSDMLYTHSPEEIVINKIDKERVRMAEDSVLKKLSPRHQNIYMLKEQGYLHREIAGELNLERSTVTKNLLYTKRKLQEAFRSINAKI